MRLTPGVRSAKGVKGSGDGVVRAREVKRVIRAKMVRWTERLDVMLRRGREGDVV